MRLLAGLTVLAATLALGGCGAIPKAPGSQPDEPPPDYENVFRGGEILVQLVPRGGDAAPRNSHPAAFDPEQLQALLMSLRVESEGEGVVTLASPERLFEVSEHLVEAFARARPSQDVFLVFFRSKSGDMMFSSQRQVTSSRVFFRDDTLHVIFDELDAFHSPFRDPQTNPMRPGERDQEAAVDGERLVQADAWEWHGDRRDWVELAATPEAIKAAKAAIPSMTATGVGQGAQVLDFGPASDSQRSRGSEQRKPADNKGPAEQAAGPASTPESAGETKEPVSATAGAEASNDSGREEWAKIEDRLEKLKRLRERGLITEQDYADKKAELLEELP